MNIKCRAELTTGLIYDYLYAHASSTVGGYILLVTGAVFIGLYIYSQKAVMLGVALILLLYFPSRYLMQAYRLKRTAPAFSAPIEYEFNKAGVRMKTVKAKELAPWERIFRVDCSRKSFFFYTSPANAFIVPFQALSGKEENLLSLLADSLPAEKLTGILRHAGFRRARFTKIIKERIQAKKESTKEA